MTKPIRHDLALLDDDDLHLFAEGSHYRAYRNLGARLREHDGERGVGFAVWAPAAEAVHVMGDFDGWAATDHPLRRRGESGIWEGFVPGLARGARYKYRVTQRGGKAVDKADPYGLRHETPPATASIVWDLEHQWADSVWLAERAARQTLSAPMSIYEVHLGSWVRGGHGTPLGYREIAPRLADHVCDAGFTHVELMPLTEHPFYGSWGYQSTGYFAPTSRHGTPQELMALIDLLHQRGIGVILDWVPSHFPDDEHGLVYFDGTHLYEPADRRRGFHPDWNSYIFDVGRPQVRSFLLSSALFWLDVYHVDGLRVDAVASMLHHDYSRDEGTWLPNVHGGRENLETIAFLRQLNEAIHLAHPDVQSIAEESAAWPLVTRPASDGGLGFDLKWDMGFMHDTLAYFAQQPDERHAHQRQLTFRTTYAFGENYVLAFSHDEVVHGKGSLLGRMPGDDAQALANLRLLLAWIWAQPGKKLLFMGGELGDPAEWSHDGSMDWTLRTDERHAGVLRLVTRLNTVYRGEPALHARDCVASGFEWVHCSDDDRGVVALLRHGNDDEVCLVALNFTAVTRERYRLGVPRAGHWQELLCTDETGYGGAGRHHPDGVHTAATGEHGHPHSVELTLPGLAAVFLSGPVTADEAG